MTVIPGSTYVEFALRLHKDWLNAPIGVIGPIEFLNPIILSERIVHLSVRANWVNSQKVRYTFSEAESGVASVSGRPCAIVEIGCKSPAEANGGFVLPAIKTFQERAKCLRGSEDFYKQLLENGNQYGPRFQTLQRVWLLGDEVLGQLRVDNGALGTTSYHLSPIMLDGISQVMSVFSLERGQTFILQGFEEISFLSADFPKDIWVSARLRRQGQSTVHGQFADLDAFDESGTHLMRLRGARFTHLDRLAPSTSTTSPKTPILIASTFTAEPIQDSLQFWSDYFGFRTQVAFASYNQVFQELLSPHSKLRSNQDGFNVILLNLGDWAAGGLSLGLKPDSGTAAARFGDLDRHTLPNRIEVAHLNRHETEYVYQEIFEDRCYLRHGIRLPEDATVIDVGANIGLFSLFVRNCCSRASVYAFEPSPVAFRALKANCEVYGPGLYPFNLGVSERRGSAALTYYAKSSVFSTFHSAEEEDRRAIRAVVTNMVRQELGDTTEHVDEYVEELTQDRLDRQTFECPLVSVSDIIRDNGLQCVNLLKVDAEKCELEILRGIDEELWPRIHQVVVEVHDRSRCMVSEVEEILAKQGFQCAVEAEHLLAGSGLYNVYATRTVSRELVEPARIELQAKVDQFVQALDSFAQNSEAATVLCFCPPGKANAGQTVSNRTLVTLENQLVNRVREVPRVVTISSQAILERYPAAEFHDPHSAEQGHLPFTPEGFAAIGTMLSRTLIGLRRAPYKVIVLDCDNTLWQGTCGEEGPLEVLVTPGHRSLQEFMIRQMEAGMVLCLCSKNNEADVWSVFERNPDMVLKREHLAASRINWASKSENLRSLAAELNLSPDSFIFLDDNPVECAEVRANCPEALTLLLPSAPNHLARFLDHIWAFDHFRITEEDLTRTQKLLENVERENYRGDVTTLRDFIAGLQLQVTVFEPGNDQFGRVAELTLRTNQFNFTAIRRSESDIVRFLQKGHCLAAKVSDRFGDYGTVALLLYTVGTDCYEVDTFLLSCRALGRGVEYQVLSQFGRQALNQGKTWIHFQFRHTDKNQPAWDFIESVGSEFMSEVSGGACIRFPAERLAAICYEPDQLPPASRNGRQNDLALAQQRSRPAIVGASRACSEQFQRIADGLSRVEEICSSIESFRLRASGSPAASSDGELPDTLAGRMLGIWRKILANPRIGMNDNFADAGGTSLKAVQIVAAIRRELKLHLSIVNIFECPNVRLLCEKLEPGRANNAASDAMERGARRKQRLRGRAEAGKAPA
jgi:FkbH-like protein/FkbM family methyltransferase